MAWAEDKVYVINLASEVARRTTKTGNDLLRRKFSYIYHITVEGKIIIVCNSLFLVIFGMKEDTGYNSLENDKCWNTKIKRKISKTHSYS